MLSILQDAYARTLALDPTDEGRGRVHYGRARRPALAVAVYGSETGRLLGTDSRCASRVRASSAHFDDPSSVR